MKPANTAWIDGDATVADASRVMRERHVDRVTVTQARDGAAVPVGELSAREIVDRVVAVGLDARVVTASDVLSLNPP
jgi:CBS domain-containing protein